MLLILVLFLDIEQERAIHTYPTVLPQYYERRVSQPSGSIQNARLSAGHAAPSTTIARRLAFWDGDRVPHCEPTPATAARHTAAERFPSSALVFGRPPRAAAERADPGVTSN